jgi:protein-S-isoprenylcysteine O-methyltransferase Ste14
MYVTVIAVVIGEALLLGAIDLLAYAVVMWVVFHAFVVLYEEPKLRRTFGAEYDSFRDHVPRWVPRLTPWSGRADR